MKVTIVYPDVLLHRPDWTGYFYYGVGSISAALKQAGHETSLIHVVQPISEEDFIRRIKEESPDLIGFSSTSHMFPLVKMFASWLVDAGITIPTICGGIHPTIAPEKAIATKGLDMICRGEGEAPILELCRKMESGDDISDIKNLWIKKGDRIIKNPLRPLLDDLDKLPFPDRSIFNYETLYAEREGRGSFLVGRGCPYDCSYCCNHLLRKIYGTKGKPIRFRSVDNVITEIKEVINKYPSIRSLIFDDDILFLKKSWSEEFTERYRKEIGLPFTCNARANLIDESRVELLKKAGCIHVKFGIESGNENISNNILKRQLKNSHIINAFSLCKKAGLITESFNMVAVPNDTPSTILDTIKLNARIEVDNMQVTIFQPYIGTKLAEFCEEKYGLKSDDLASDFFSPSILKLESVKPSQALMFRDYFKVLVRYYQVLLKLPSWLSNLCIRISDAVLSCYMTSKILNFLYIPLNYLYRRFLVWKVRSKTPFQESAPLSAKSS
jgi:radical SAM superfamily enzyme YgiQ (UPF0313 family)